MSEWYRVRAWMSPDASGLLADYVQNWSYRSGDFNQDGFADLAAAAPMEDVGTVSNAGALSLLPGSGTGLTTTGGRLFTQASPGIPGTPETFDAFSGLEVVFWPIVGLVGAIGDGQALRGGRGSD